MSSRPSKITCNLFKFPYRNSSKGGILEGNELKWVPGPTEPVGIKVVPLQEDFDGVHPVLMGDGPLPVHRWCVVVIDIAVSHDLITQEPDISIPAISVPAMCELYLNM